MNLFNGKQKAGVGHEAVGVLRAFQTECIRILSADGRISFIFNEAILQLGFLGCFHTVKHAFFRRDGYAVALLQIFRHQGFQKDKTAVAVRSYDPNLNTPFVQAMRKNKSESVRVIKPGRYEEPSTLELVDTGAISLDDPEKIVCPLHAAARISKLRKLAMRLQLISMLLGGIAVLLLSLLGKSALLGIPQIALYHLIWILVSVIATHTEIRENKLHLL